MHYKVWFYELCAVEEILRGKSCFAVFFFLTIAVQKGWVNTSRCTSALRQARPPHRSTMYSWHRTYGICDALPISTSPTQIATLTSPQTTQKGLAMFLIGILFLGLWIAGEATAKTMGGFIHVLLILSLTVLVSQMIRGQRDSR